MIYSHIFDTDQQFKAKYNSEDEADYYEPWCSLTLENDEVNYNKPPKPEKTPQQFIDEWKSTPLTFKALSAGTLTFGEMIVFTYSDGGGN